MIAPSMSWLGCMAQSGVGANARVCEKRGIDASSWSLRRQVIVALPFTYNFVPRHRTCTHPPAGARVSAAATCDNSFEEGNCRVVCSVYAITCDNNCTSTPVWESNSWEGVSSRS
jgi:hypothetical protein